MEDTMKDKQFVKFIEFAVATESGLFGAEEIARRYCMIRERGECAKLVRELLRKEIKHGANASARAGQGSSQSIAEGLDW
ncbi:MAG: hypothetical protein M1360_03490 [Candidatus Marsarchaeota archaeon]|jgi:hypothetical protein|nr:hypothetical protein [Candidatus Marsarchaeota archaeon]MCL5418976.1 hypothetical protein [Candidatus Marsarchaeota archaeon]